MIQAPSDRYYDVVGWPQVRVTAHRVQRLYELDSATGTAKWDGYPRYWRLAKGDAEVVIDLMAEGVELWERADDMTWRARMPLWVADFMRVPAAMRDA